MPNIKYLTEYDILYIHLQLAYEAYKDDLPEIIEPLGILKHNEFFSSVERPKSGFGETEFYPTLTDKAAILLYSLIMNHPFRDGNKRTAMLSTEFFLMLNGCGLSVPVSEYVDFAKDVAKGNCDLNYIKEWIRAHKVDISSKGQDIFTGLWQRIKSQISKISKPFS